MYGRLFESLYHGSMVGAGCPVFAVWGYVIAHMREDSQVGAQVDLNPKLVAFILGEDEGVINEAISFLCSVDPQSTSKDEEGRRLVRLGEFAYRVVNGAKYMAIRNAEEKREYNRKAKVSQRLRAKAGLAPRPKGRPGGTADEREYVKAVENGEEKEAERILDRASEVVPRGTVGLQVDEEKAGKTESGMSVGASIGGGTAESRTTPLEMAHNPLMKDHWLWKCEGCGWEVWVRNDLRRGEVSCPECSSKRVSEHKEEYGEPDPDGLEEEVE